MTLLEKKKLEKVLKKFNDEECGGGFIYFLHLQGKQEMLVQLDLTDYSTVIVCPVSQILNVEYLNEEEGIYIELEEKFEGIDSCWIDFMGCQF